eukprot:jgi/Picre1/32580/NNA_007926.t1
MEDRNRVEEKIHDLESGQEKERMLRLVLAHTKQALSSIDDDDSDMSSDVGQVLVSTDDSRKPCPICGGTGKISYEAKFVHKDDPCPRCLGRGQYGRKHKSFADDISISTLGSGESGTVVPAIRQLLEETNSAIDSLEENVEPTWAGLVEPLEKIVDRIGRAWGTVSHLKAVKDTEALRKAVEEVQPEKVKVMLRLSQSKPIYEAFKSIKEGDLWNSLTEAQKRIVDGELRDFVLGGVALEGEAKERFNEIQQELSKLSTDFSNNLLMQQKHIRNSGKGEGHEDATAENGPWLFTLDFPSFFPVMTHAANRSLREEMYKANITRASSGESDNTPIINKILTLRQEKAKILGFDNFAEVSMASKMADLASAEELLEKLRAASYDAAVKDLDDVKKFAAEQGFSEELALWDVTYWAERLKEAKYAISDEELRPYFALPNVLDGLFKLAKRLYDVDIVPADGKVPVWDKDVRFFEVQKNGKAKAYFYLDPYSRPAEKRGGADG